MLAKYLDALEATGGSPKSIATRRIMLTQFLDWMEQTTGSRDELSITSIDAARYRKHLQDLGRKPNTVNTALSSIDAFCAWMANEGYLTHNPVRDVKRIEVAQKAPRGLTKNEQHRLIRTALAEKDSRNGVIVLTLLFSGLRVSELVHLTPDDVLISERAGVITVRAGKGNKYREVPIPRDLRKPLGEFLTKRRSMGRFLFEGQRDPQLTPRAVQLLCKRVGGKAKIADLTPHVLRHTMAHNLVGAGVSLDKVAVILGHSSLNTTAIYTRPRLDDLQNSMETLNYT